MTNLAEFPLSKTSPPFCTASPECGVLGGGELVGVTFSTASTCTDRCSEMWSDSRAGSPPGVRVLSRYRDVSAIGCSAPCSFSAFIKSRMVAPEVRDGLVVKQFSNFNLIGNRIDGKLEGGVVCLKISVSVTVMSLKAMTLQNDVPGPRKASNHPQCPISSCYKT